MTTHQQKIKECTDALAKCTDPVERRRLAGRLGGLRGIGSLGRRIAALKGARAMKNKAEATPK
jgi:hypothetical protein